MEDGLRGVRGSEEFAGFLLGRSMGIYPFLHFSSLQCSIFKGVNRQDAKVAKERKVRCWVFDAKLFLFTDRETSFRPRSEVSKKGTRNEFFSPPRREGRQGTRSQMQGFEGKTLPLLFDVRHPFGGMVRPFTQEPSTRFCRKIFGMPREPSLIRELSIRNPTRPISSGC